ncbi:MAG: FMN-binding protein, partial [Acidobacteria bacterium]|nr:FMN-binding protein [Acidobacteriota bacterium]
KQRILTVLFTIAITIVFVAPISFVYLLTKGQVALNEEVFLKRAVLAAAGIPVPSANGEVVSLFSARAEEVKAGDAAPASYRIKPEAGGEPAGYVFVRSGPGLWGEITTTVGFDAELASLTGVDFLKQSETPGLGARISEKWFTEQFRGKKGPFTTVGEGEPAAENQFDAITGASITSNAVLSILNTTIDQVKDLAR